VRVQLVMSEDEIGGYIALVPELPGRHTRGDTLGEVLENKSTFQGSPLG